MGWLFMSRGGMSPFAAPKAYLDNQCTYPPESGQRPRDGAAGAQVDGPLRCLLRRLPELRCRRSQGDLCDHLPRQMEPRRAQRGRVWLQGQCAVAALKRSIKDDEVS
jgi:hypothetical protein